MRIIKDTEGVARGFDHATSIERDDDGTFIVTAPGVSYRISKRTGAALGFAKLAGRQELPGYRPTGVNDQVRVVE
ncbi:MAG: hypothetical protein L0Z50_40590 [Verrucomicrobiales bacterium]|nr:hypothetical protein [Verrucomicrobiales bacterium]